MDNIVQLMPPLEMVLAQIAQLDVIDLEILLQLQLMKLIPQSVMNVLLEPTQLLELQNVHLVLLEPPHLLDLMLLMTVLLVLVMFMEKLMPLLELLPVLLIVVLFF
jgi:hypothetical protein